MADGIINDVNRKYFFQHLTRKKDKSDLAVKSWKVQSHHNVLISKALDCLSSVNPESNSLSLEQKKQIQEGKMVESAKTQALALEMAAHIDAIGSEKPKTQNG